MTQRTLHMELWLKSASTHIHVRTSGPRILDRPPKLLLPLPRISVLGGYCVLARAHLYAGAPYLVVRGLGPEC